MSKKSKGSIRHDHERNHDARATGHTVHVSSYGTAYGSSYGSSYGTATVVPKSAHKVVESGARQGRQPLRDMRQGHTHLGAPHFAQEVLQGVRVGHRQWNQLVSVTSYIRQILRTSKCRLVR